MYWTPPPPRSDHWTLLLKYDDLFLGPRDIGRPLSKILDTPLDGDHEFQNTAHKYNIACIHCNCVFKTPKSWSKLQFDSLLWLH